MILGVLIFLKLCIGIYVDDEFPERCFFVKHRPIWKSYFYSPRGMSDIKLSKMSEDRRKEQLLFDEFILGIPPEKNDW